MRALGPTFVQRRLFILLIVVAAWASFASAAERERVFPVRGIVRAPYHDGAITIEHEEIPGFMPAMTMPFYADAADVRALAPGDRVEFLFRVGVRSRATDFRKVDAAAPSEAPTAPVQTKAAAKGPRLRAGDTVPGFSLHDQDERALTGADLKGRHTIVTFVFTRCPVPEFCPLIGKKFQALQAALSKRDRPSEAQLLSISIDPEHDQAGVLRDYGKSLGADFSSWRFATGAPAEIEKLRRAFAIHTERNQGVLDHTLATALIDPEGRVVDIWRGNRWKPEEILARLPGTPS
ncbi:MAG TPA: SCO family protein, partial [Opitutaceae bacterium]